MTILLEKLHPDFVVEVRGVNLAQAIDIQTRSALQAAIDEHAVLVFHGPKLSEEQQVAFSLNFGQLETSNGVLSTDVKRRVSHAYPFKKSIPENQR